MSLYSRPSPRALFRDRRVQIGGVVALSAVALLGAGVIAILASSRADATPPEMAGPARLTIVDQPAPKAAVPVVYDKLATLDPDRLASQGLDRVDPDVKAMLVEERRADREAALEQRAFDLRMRADLQDAPAADPQPAQRGGWTSNAEDVAETAPT